MPSWVFCEMFCAWCYGFILNPFYAMESWQNQIYRCTEMQAVQWKICMGKMADGDIQGHMYRCVRTKRTYIYM